MMEGARGAKIKEKKRKNTSLGESEALKGGRKREREGYTRENLAPCERKYIKKDACDGVIRCVTRRGKENKLKRKTRKIKYNARKRTVLCV